MITYVAFLRAINVGGHQLIKMEELRRVFESLGLKDVRTYIQSGNVIFDTTSTNSTALTRKIEKRLKEVTGHEVTVILRELSEIEVLVKTKSLRENQTELRLGAIRRFLISDAHDETEAAIRIKAGESGSPDNQRWRGLSSIPPQEKRFVRFS